MQTEIYFVGIWKEGFEKYRGKLPEDGGMDGSNFKSRLMDGSCPLDIGGETIYELKQFGPSGEPVGSSREAAEEHRAQITGDYRLPPETVLLCREIISVEVVDKNSG